MRSYVAIMLYKLLVSMHDHFTTGASIVGFSDSLHKFISLYKFNRENIWGPRSEEVESHYNAV